MSHSADLNSTHGAGTIRVNVYGLGYVGCVSAACLANDGIHVTGVDVDHVKVQSIKQGRSPIVEPGLESAIAEAVSSGRLQVTCEAVQAADVSIVCVGTPSNENGSLKLDHLVRATQQIGAWLRHYPRYHVVNYRSTMLPGTVENELIPILAAVSGKQPGRDFGVCMNPEFMREGTSIKDFYDPPFTLIGQLDERSGAAVEAIYGAVRAPIHRTSIKVAEMMKYASNAFHALKITFANEMGNFCKKHCVDAYEMMDVFCQDDKLNLSTYYLKPGFAFGGSCLPKDLRALLYKARQVDLELPMLGSILPSNRRQVDEAFRLIAKSRQKNVGILGLSFKPGTDDLRESPMVDLIEMLIGKGYDITIYDREVSLSNLYGANKRYIESMIPHISRLMSDSAAEVLQRSSVIVVGKSSDEYRAAIEQRDAQQRDLTIIDLARLFSTPPVGALTYEGICS